MFQKLKILFIAGVCLISARLPAQDSKNIKDYVRLNGYIKDMRILSFDDDIDNLVTNNFIHNRVNLKGYVGDFTIGLESRNRLFYGEGTKLNPFYSNYLDQDNGLVDLSFVLLDKKAVILHSMIDRAWVNWSTPTMDIRLGRQRINWGVNLVWNPNDLFNAFNFVDFDYEERPGSDALRVQYYMPNMASAELAVKPDTNPDEWVVAGMYKFNKWTYDIQFLGGWYHKDIALGTGWAGNLKNAGLKGEATYFHPQENFTDTSGVLNASVSFDYSFRNGLYVHASTLFNSQGATKPGVASGLFNQNSLALSPKNLMPAKYSLFGQASGNFSPILNASFASIYSPGVNSLLLMPSLTLSIKTNWDMSLFVQSFWTEVNNEFNTLGNGIFVRLKWSY